MNIPIVFEDEWLAVLDKPSGLLVIPTPKKEARTLTSILNDDLKEKNITYRLHPCHRLDRETSGLIIYAKGKSIQQKMMDEFRDRKVEKLYLAFVQGCPPAESGTIKNSIEGKSAQTRYRVVEKTKDFCVLEVMPLTGRTNQIRIHLKQLGCPILGETKFAFRRDFSVRAKRLCLHAGELRFRHPATGNPVHLKADLPLDMQKLKEAHA